VAATGSLRTVKDADAVASERIQRIIDQVLDEAEKAAGGGDWAAVQALCRRVLSLDPESADAQTLLAGAERGLSQPASTEPPAPVSPRPGVSGAEPPSGGVEEASSTANKRESQGEGSPERSTVPRSFANGRYTVRRFLGEGGKKKVYLAHDTLLDRDVAFALIKTEGLDDVGRDRITREAQAMGRLGAHPHIVSVFDLGTEPPLPGSSTPLPLGEGRGEGNEGTPYIVTELMGGGDVEGLIEESPEHRPPLERTLEIGIAICRGLEFAHSHGIVDRDLKPGNVWLTADGTAKLGDFGLAVALDRSRLTQAGMMVGTVSYMPPEQAMGGEVTPSSDLYSLGAMLYEMVTGRPPFVGDDSVAIITQHLNTAPVSPSWHNAEIPPPFEALILCLLEKNPAKRPQTAAQVRQALESISTLGTGAMNRAPTPGGGRRFPPSLWERVRVRATPKHQRTPKSCPRTPSTAVLLWAESRS